MQSIDDTVYGRLGYLFYSTQTRNLAHLLMLEEYLSFLYSYHKPNRGLGRMYQYNLLRVRADIIETWLFCAIFRLGITPKTDRSGKVNAGRLVSLAKSSGLITSKTADLCSRIVGARNDLHPERQISLLVQISDGLLEVSCKVIPLLEGDLRSVLIPKTAVECDWCSTGAYEGKMCPACGRFCW